MDLLGFTSIVLLLAGRIVGLAPAWMRVMRADESRGARGPNLVARALAVAPSVRIVSFAVLVARAWIRIGERHLGLD